VKSEGRVIDMPNANIMFRIHEVIFDDPAMADRNGWYWEKISAVDEAVRVDRLVGPFSSDPPCGALLPLGNSLLISTGKTKPQWVTNPIARAERRQ
jgi:hypothetical protein